MTVKFDKNQEQWYEEEEKPIGKCAMCGEDLYQGDYAYLGIDGEFLCSTECVAKYYSRKVQVGSEEKW